MAIKYGPHWQEAFRHMRRPWWLVALLALVALYFSTGLLWCIVSASTNQPLNCSRSYSRRSRRHRPVAPWVEDADESVEAFSGTWWWIFSQSAIYFAVPAGVVFFEYRNGWIIHRMDRERDAEKERKKRLQSIQGDGGDE